MMPRLASILWLMASAGACGAQSPPATLQHFAQIDNGVYAGSKPHTDQDFEYLKDRHIRYIVNAHFLPFFTGSERRKAKRYGIEFVAIPMNASFIPPSRKNVNRILLTLHDPRYQPVYTHCVLGRDRTSLISGLYKIYFKATPKTEAWTEMRKSGFKTWFFLRGLKSYFDRNADRPPTAAELSEYEAAYHREHAAAR